MKAPAALRELPLFAPLTDADLQLLRGHCRWEWYQPGEAIVRQGQAAGDFCVVALGRVELLLEGEIPTRLGLLGPGEFFAELEALTGEPASASAIAREVTSLVRLSPEGLLLLLERNGELNRRIITTLAARVREAGARLHRTRLRERSLSDHITRQAAATYREWVGRGPWSQRVKAAIARGSRTLEPVVFVGEPGTGKELAAARLHYNSHRGDGPFIVLDGARWTEESWAESLRLAAHGSLLIKNAHLLPEEAVRRMAAVLPSAAGEGRGRLPSRVPRLLMTAPPPEDREPSPAEALLLREGFAVWIPSLRERREDLPALVRHFLRKHGLLPEGEAALRPVSPEAMRRLERYPFLRGNVRELERVVQQAALRAEGGVIQAEHLHLGETEVRSGRPRVALALGGGAVRGCAHIGVLQVLEEARIPIDMVVGTSSGALIGALYAGGMDPQRMAELLPKVGWLDLAEPCWPRGGFLTSRRMRAFLDRYIGPVAMPDLRLPFAAVAGDATTGHEVILREGPVAEAVRASTAIPGVFLPVQADGRLLVDGVVVNNVPASVARAMGADVVIAVDVTQYAFASGPPRSFAEAVMRSFDIMARQSIAASLEWADVVIRPEVGGLSGFSFRSAPEFVRRGRAAAREALPRIQARLEARRNPDLAG